MKDIKKTALIMLENNSFEEVIDWVISKYESQLKAESDKKTKTK